jgi:hypothetical protein
MKTVWIIIITAVIAAGISGGAVYYFTSQKADKDKQDLSNQIGTLSTELAVYKSGKSATTDSESTSSTSATTEANSAEKNAATQAISSYLTAKQTRGLSNAKPYMTDNFYATYDQETFAGVSSPSMSRYEIISVNAGASEVTFTASTKLYYSLQGQEVGYYPNSYKIIKVGDKYLVDSETAGTWTEL